MIHLLALVEYAAKASMNIRGHRLFATNPLSFQGSLVVIGMVVFLLSTVYVLVQLRSF